jgi:hypothetical protein
MQRRGDNSIKARVASALGRNKTAPVRGKATPVVRPPVPKRRVPRREIEARRQRLVRWGVAIAGVLTLLIIVGGLLYEQVIKPNQTLATVGGTSISRQDYWRARANDLYEQSLQYRDFAQFVGADQQGQYLTLAQQALSEIPEVWGSTDVDRASLQKMIDDQTYLQGLDDLGLTLTPEEVHTFALNRFAPPGAPLLTPVPTPTFIPERAAVATRTAEALFATPVATPGVGTPLAGTPVGTPPATPVSGTPRATPVSDVPTAEATPEPAAALATAEAGFAEFADAFFPLAHLSPEDYERLVAAPALARQKVQDALAATVGQSAPQVNAAHILVASKEEADAARARIVEGGEEFATVARELSTDAATAANGGDLGWFTREEMTPPFAEAAFGLEPGSISEPVETEFGWHLIAVEESDPDRLLTDAQISRIEQALVDRWLEEQRTATAISSSLAPTPTPFTRPFAPPAGAPPLPTATPLPATPGATPVGISSVGTPVG